MSSNVSVTVASGESLDVREFRVSQALSTLFEVTLQVVSDNPNIDFDGVIGQAATFTLHGLAADGNNPRTWSGLAAEMHQLRVEPAGLSTYELRIVPSLWLLTQRRNHRMFQMMSELEIATALLGEWGVAFTANIAGQYKKRKYRVQYGETDFAFLSRMLEDAGITFFFEGQASASQLVLADAPQGNDPRTPPIAFRDDPLVAPDREHVTAVRIGRRVRPGKYTMRDVDYRLPPTYPLLAAAGAPDAVGVERQLERFHYTPGAFLFESDKGGDTPHADDRGSHRTDEAEGQRLATKRLAASRGDALTATFATNVIDLWPGVVTSLLDHPHRALGDGVPLLVTASRIEGVTGKEWTCQVDVRGAAEPYYPEVKTPKPKVQGVESAVVVGPVDEEIHTDEFGRARVQFHWDREGSMNERSSCWIPVSQPWGGAGYGSSSLPRVGQEVLVDFLGGDPDRPMIVGRVYTNLQKTPYKLPDNKAQSGMKSNSTGGSGGYNEVMMDDSGGQELLRVQAQKDHHVLVKNDEQHTVGGNRSRSVGGNEDVTVGANRTKTVVQNEQHMIGASHSLTVGQNRATQVGLIDSTIVGDTHVVQVSPPGEGLSDLATSTTITNGKIVFTTGSATITMDGNVVTIDADTIHLKGKSGVKITATGPVDVNGSLINLNC